MWTDCTHSLATSQVASSQVASSPVANSQVTTNVMAVDSAVQSTSLMSGFTTNESGITISVVGEFIAVPLHKLVADLSASQQTTGAAAYTSGPGNLASVSL